MAPAARSAAPVHLKSGSFVPSQTDFAAGSQKYFIVQFAGPIQEAWKDAVTTEGAEILAYIPDFAFKVRMSPGIAKRVEGNSFVNAVVAYQPEFKLGADLKLDGETRLYQIRIEKGSDYGLVRSLIARTGSEVLSFDDDMLVVAANGAFANAIAEVDDVASINNYFLNQTFSTLNQPPQNDNAVQISLVRALQIRAAITFHLNSGSRIPVWAAGSPLPHIAISMDVLLRSTPPGVTDCASNHHQ
jgi:hypothetical protein